MKKVDVEGTIANLRAAYEQLATNPGEELTEVERLAITPLGIDMQMAVTRFMLGTSCDSAETMVKATATALVNPLANLLRACPEECQHDYLHMLIDQINGNLHALVTDTDDLELSHAPIGIVRHEVGDA